MGKLGISTRTCPVRWVGYWGITVRGQACDSSLARKEVVALLNGSIQADPTQTSTQTFPLVMPNIANH